MLAENIIPITTEDVEQKSLTIIDQAKAVKVTDADTYISAGFLWKTIGDMIKEVKDTFDPICDAAFAAHRAATSKRAKYLDPLTKAYTGVKKLMSDYDEQQIRIAQAEQRRLEEIARKEEEERRLMEAIAAEEILKSQGVTKEEIAQEVSAIIEEPVSVAPVVVQKSTPKLQGGPVYRTVWKFRIKDVSKIPREYMVPDEVKIGQIVRALKKQTNIPGIEPYEERC